MYACCKGCLGLGWTLNAGKPCEDGKRKNAEERLFFMLSNDVQIRYEDGASKNY
jgi:hypothetical protein